MKKALLIKTSQSVNCSAAKVSSIPPTAQKTSECFIITFEKMFPMRGGLVEGDGLVEEGLNMRGLGSGGEDGVIAHRFQDDAGAVFDIADFLEVADKKWLS